MEIKNKRIEELKPNCYNPNRMTDERYQELLKEIEHLGRIPKPIIVDKDGVIIDGEHTWRAAQELKYSDLPCEIVDVSDFEKRRLTFKYNQHGQHDPVLLGKMLKEMCEMEGLSQRELAKRINISEGTVRNALLFLEAQDDLRNGYALNRFSVRQIRMYQRMKEKINPMFARAWLKGGAKEKSLIEVIEFDCKNKRVKESINSILSRWDLEELLEDVMHVNDACWEGIKKDQSDFIRLSQKVLRNNYFIDETVKIFSFWGRSDGYKKIKDYLPLYFKGIWPFNTGYWFRESLKFLLTEKEQFLLTSEELLDVAKEAEGYSKSGKKGISFDDFTVGFLKRKIKEKHGSFSKENFYETERAIFKSKLDEAPEYIRNANYKTYSGEDDSKAKYELWQMRLDEDVKRIVTREGFKPNIHNWERVVNEIKKTLKERETIKLFDNLTKEETAKQTTEFLKNICKQFKLTEQEKDFLDNQFEKWISEFLKGCPVGKYLSYAFFKIAGESNYIEYLKKMFKNIDRR